MGGTGNKNEPPKKPPGDRPLNPSPAPVKRDDLSPDDVEDGDFATPKRDRDGDDDQPL